jgi:hypothetical protein
MEDFTPDEPVVFLGSSIFCIILNNTIQYFVSQLKDREVKLIGMQTNNKIFINFNPY